MTTSEIAKRLGISRGTVSRVLNNNPNVKDETRQIVLAEFQRSGYTPNEVARSLVMKQTNKIAVVVFSEPQFFWKQVEHGVTSAENELKVHGTSVDYFVTDIMDPNSQLELVKSLPEKGYTAIAIAPNDPQLLMEEIDKLTELKIPVVLLNVDIPTANRLCYVGCDYTQSGVLAAEILANSMNRKGNVAVLTLKDSVISIDQRMTGFRQELSRFGDITIKQVSRFCRNAVGVYDEVKSLLRNNPQIDGIYVSFGALEQTAQAIQDSNINRYISVVGYDLSEEIYTYIKKDIITATICHEPFNQGYFSVKILHNFLNRGLIPSSSIMYSKLEIIFSANAKYYLNEKKYLDLFYL